MSGTLLRGPAQIIKMKYLTKAYRDQLCTWEMTAMPHACLLCKQYARKHFVQLKTIDFNNKHISPLILRLKSTYYAFGCTKYICKKCHLRNLYKCTAGICVAYKKKNL